MDRSRRARHLKRKHIHRKAHKVVSRHLVPASTPSMMDPEQIKFCQQTVSPCFRRGGAIVVHLLRFLGTGHPGQFPPMRVIELRGKLYSLDNRRLLMFRIMRRYGLEQAPVHLYRIAPRNKRQRKLVRKWSGRAARRYRDDIAIGRVCCCGREHNYELLLLMDIMAPSNSPPLVRRRHDTFTDMVEGMRGGAAGDTARGSGDAAADAAAPEPNLKRCRRNR